jgi:hypothetical protein
MPACAPAAERAFEAGMRSVTLRDGRRTEIWLWARWGRPLIPPASRQIDGSASARGEAPPSVAFPTPPAIKTDRRPNVAARRSALMV